MLSRYVGLWPLAAAPAAVFAALQVDLSSPASVRDAAALVAEDLFSFYEGNKPGKIPGILPGPPPDGDYYWWQGGALWGTYLDYWRYTGDTKYNSEVNRSMLFQVGQDRDYNPANWSASMGNDDQAFWALSALQAAEYGFEDPPEKEPQWLALAQAVFNEQVSIDRRASGGNCDWALRWQVYPSNRGYNYINTIANACFFNIGARLARYTDNATYAELASKTWDTIIRLGYIDNEGNVFDGAHLPDCTEINKAQFSYNAAMLLQGASFLYNFTTGTERSTWETRVNFLLDQIVEVFFPNGTAFEPSCEGHNCNADMRSYKGYLHRWMASTTQLAPFTRDKIMPLLRSSTEAAVKQCTGGDNGRMCGFHWSRGEFDGIVGAGQQMNVLAALSSLLVEQAVGPVTNATGGTSRGNPNAGVETTDYLNRFAPITAGDKAGAAILTILLLGLGSAIFWAMLVKE